MNTKKLMKIAVMCVSIFSSVALADVTNVALDKPVTLNGVFFTDGWGGGIVVGAGTVVDGVFFPRAHQWDQGPVWWDSSGVNTGQSIVIDLEGVYVIESLIVQADDNDSYILYYWDIVSEDWVVAWDVPNLDAGNWGMQTRPNPDDDTERYDLASPIITNALKIEGNMSDTVSDKMFAVSEVQAFGLPALEVQKELTTINSSDEWDLDPTYDLPLVPTHTPLTFTMLITITNNTQSDITSIVVKDRLGGDLEFISSIPATTTNQTKGNSDKVFLEWELGTLGAGLSTVIELTVATDVNPGTGNGKKAGNQEYTSEGIHELNSGANAKGIYEGMQVSDSSDSISVYAEDED